MEEFVFYWPSLANVRQKDSVSASQERVLEKIASQRFTTLAGS